MGPAILLGLPPFTDANTAYPSTAYLTGFLRTRGIEVEQRDWSIAAFDRLLSGDVLARLAQRMEEMTSPLVRATSPVAQYYLTNRDAIIALMPAVLSHLRGTDRTAHTFLSRPEVFPQSAMFREQLAGRTVQSQFAVSSQAQRASHLCGMFLHDVFRSLRAVDPDFEISRYAESLVSGPDSLEPILYRLTATTFVDEVVDEVVTADLLSLRPELLGLSAPFPGNVYYALRIGMLAKRLLPGVKVALGGGFPNTSLRELDDPRVFDFVDFVCLDDGERPMLSLIEHLRGERRRQELTRTFHRNDSGKVEYIQGDTSDPSHPHEDIPHAEVGTPTYTGMPLDKYFSFLLADWNSFNPFMKLYNGYRWNKLTVAHGCYWKKCTFCDIHLDYISRYEPVAADVLVDRIDAMVKETGVRGFHFVDEAAPPAMLKHLSKRLVERRVPISWFGNIRFDKAFTAELAKTMAEGGCIGVTGGIEVASDRILKLIAKGTTVEQVARVARNFSRAGILVHGYLMYGFPTQTVQEVVDSLEVVRQLFRAGILHSAAWHLFGVTPYSPVGRDPRKFATTLEEVKRTPENPYRFNHYVIRHVDDVPVDYASLRGPLYEALAAYMVGDTASLDRPVHTWFRDLPPTTVAPDMIARAIADDVPVEAEAPASAPSPGLVQLATARRA